MDDTPSEPSPGDPIGSVGKFERILERLVLAEDAVAHLQSLSEHAAVLVMADGSQVLVLRCVPGGEDVVAHHLKRVVKTLKTGMLTLLVLGGDDRIRKALRSAQPAVMIRRKVGVVHLSEQGELWTGPYSSSRSILVRKLRELADDDGEVPGPELRARLSQEMNREDHRGREVVEFGNQLRRTRPVATIALVAVCTAVYGLQLLWGATDFLPAMVRMGANLSTAVFEGDWYRPVSCMFLHGGFQHLLFNMMVLFYLGGFLEKLIGPARFLVLYGVSGLAGSLASIFLSGGQVSVGASGALWGILGASAALAYRPAGLVPEAVLPRLKRAAMINLGINLVVSFLPQVDMYAHFGGGCAGAVLVGSGWLTRGLTAEPADRPQGPGRGSSWPVPAAILVVALLLTGITWGIVAGKAWRLGGPVTWQPRPLGASGLTIRVPDIIETDLTRVPREDVEEYVAGQITRDPVMLDIVLAAYDDSDMGPGDLDREFEQLKKVRTDLIPQGVRRIGKVQERVIGGVRTWVDRFRLSNGLKLQRFLQLRSGLVVNLEILVWPDLPKGLKLDLETALVP